jgi:hypothetical protein
MYRMMRLPAALLALLILYSSATVSYASFNFQSCPAPAASNITCNTGYALSNVPAGGLCFCYCPGVSTGAAANSMNFSASSATQCTPSACASLSSSCIATGNVTSQALLGYAPGYTGPYVNNTGLALWTMGPLNAVSGTLPATGLLCYGYTSSFSSPTAASGVSLATVYPSLATATLTITQAFTSSQSACNSALTAFQNGTYFGQSSANLFYGFYACNTNNCNTVAAVTSTYYSPPPSPPLPPPPPPPKSSATIVKSAAGIIAATAAAMFI